MYSHLVEFTLMCLVFSFPGSRFPGARDSRPFSFPDSRELKRHHSRGKRERVKDSVMLSSGNSFTDFHENQLAKVQVFKVDFHENHKFVQFKQY